MDYYSDMDKTQYPDGLDLTKLDEGDKMTLWAALNVFVADLNANDLGDDEHGRFMTAAYKARTHNLMRRLHPELDWHQPKNEPEQTLNAAGKGGNEGIVNAHHDRERTRLQTILSLLGETEEVQIGAGVRLDEAIKAHPDGVLALTHGPVTEPTAEFRGTFETLVAMWWQDREDYGAVYNELLWSRQ